MGVLTSREDFQGFAALLLAAERTQALYPPGHHRVHDAIRDLYLRLRNLLQNQRRIQIGIVDREFVVGKTQHPAEGEMLSELLEAFHKVSVGKLVIREGLRQWEVQAFLKLLSTDPGELTSRGGMEAALKADGVEHLSASPLLVRDDSVDTDMLITAWEAYGTGIKAIRRLRHAARTEGRLGDLGPAHEFVEQMTDVASREIRPLLALHSLKVHDDYSFTHSVNVALLTLCMARALEFSADDLRDITLAGLLHDIGKERVDKQVLNKPGKLDDTEWEEMRKHSSEGAKMLADAPDVGPLAPIVAYEHQLAYEKDNPDYGQWQLHVVSQLVCIADIYDALRSVRPYRGEMSPDRALEIMEEESGDKLDDDLFQGFARMVGFYPPGTCVELTDGSLAISYQANPHDLRRPNVLRVRDASGEQIEPVEDLDLSASEDDGDGLGVECVVSNEEAGIDPFDYF